MRAVGAAADWAAARSLPGTLALAALLGVLAALGQAPVGAWPVTLAALAPVYAIFERLSGWRQAAWLGLAVGTGYFMLTLSWIVEPFLVDAARHGWMAPFALIFLSAGLSLFWAAGFALARAAGGGSPAWIGGVVLAEAGRTYLLTGFPWAQLGHIWIDTPVLHWSSWAGSLGLTALTLAGAAAIWHLLAGRHTAAVATLAALAVLYGSAIVLRPTPAATGERPVIRLVQPNAPQHEKWRADKVREFFTRQLSFTRAPGKAGRAPDLIVWPETAIPWALDEAGPALELIAEAAGDTPVVLGLRRIDGVNYYNSMIAVGPGGRVDALYDKHHLVPFGEYIPFGNLLGRFGIGGLATREGYGYSSGPGARLLDLEGLGRALPLICYEGVFPQDVAAAPGRPDFMLLITNDAWFGRISGPYQHLAQARLRSAEQGVPMIRVANTGISAVIGPVGHVMAELPLGQAGWLDAPLPPTLPPTVYARTGDLPMLVLALSLLLVFPLHNVLTGRRK